MLFYKCISTAYIQENNKKILLFGVIFMKIEDTFALGAISALVASIPQVIFDWISHYYLFRGKYQAYQISSGVYLHPQLTNDPMGIALGVIVWITQAMVLGIIMTYVLKKSGKDFWWLKGLLISNGIMHIWIYGFLLTLGAGRIVPFDMRTNWTIMVDNTIFGLLTPYFIIRWSKEGLLQPKK